MKTLKEQISQYQPVVQKMLASKSTVEISDILALKQFIAYCEKKATDLNDDEKASIQRDLLLLKVSLKTLKSANVNLKEMEKELAKSLMYMEKECANSTRITKRFAEKIQFLENFITSLRFAIEDLSEVKKTLIEMDIQLLELYIDLTKSKFVRLTPKESKDTALVEFLSHLKFQSAHDAKGKTDPLTSNLKTICKYVFNNPQLYCDLEIGQATYISKEYTNLAYTLQIKKTEDGFQLYVSLKRKLEDWMRIGGFKTVKKNIMLIKGDWVDGVDAVVYGDKDSKKTQQKINLTLNEAKISEKLDPLYVHKIEPAAAYTRENKDKHSFISRLADGSLQDFVYRDEKRFSSMDINKLFLMVYSTASALAYLHSEKANLVHLDVKLDNFLVFIDQDNIPWVKISDFGFSHHIKDSAHPEKDKGADVKQLGYALHELIKEFSKIHPETEDSDVIEDLLLLVDNLTSTKTPPQAYQIIEVLNCMLEKMDETDPSSASWIKEKLEKYYQSPLSKPQDSQKLIQGFFSQHRYSRSSESSTHSSDSSLTAYSS
jgi:hypothetical protein